MYRLQANGLFCVNDLGILGVGYQYTDPGRNFFLKFREDYMLSG